MEVNIETLDDLLKNAIESDDASEHVVPLNEECVFSNGVYFEDFITKASVNVTILEHYPVDEMDAIDKWFVELHCDEAVFSKEVSTGEEASLVYDATPPAVEEGIDPIILPGAGMFTLNIVGHGEHHKNTSLKIRLS